MSSIVSRRVFGSDGRALGRVSAVLFAPSEPRVVGVEVIPDRIWYVISRRPRFSLLADVTLVGTDAARLTTPRLPADATGERALGCSWHDTVVWQGMPVVSAEGVGIGIVHDIAFSAESATITRLAVSTGALGDAALGRLEVDGAFVQGFDGERVIVLPGYDAIGATGGAAKHAAAGVAMAKVHGERAASSALKAGASAAAAIGRSFRRGAGRKAVDKLKSLLDDGE
jgi:sporulation protein YlmC with PRC-barrel domain